MNAVGTGKLSENYQFTNRDLYIETKLEEQMYRQSDQVAGNYPGPVSRVRMSSGRVKQFFINRKAQYTKLKHIHQSQRFSVLILIHLTHKISSKGQKKVML